MTGHPPAMGLNGNRFKPRAGAIDCPECHGYPPLKNIDGRFVPQCATCGGHGRSPAPTAPHVTT